MIRIKDGDVIKFKYTNWKGKTSIRNVIVTGLIYGSNDWHKEVQLFVEGYDLDKKENRTYAVKDISDLKLIKKG